MRRIPVSPSSRQLLILLSLAGIGGAGCATSAPALGGTMRSGTFTQISPTWAITLAPAQATFSKSPGRTQETSATLGKLGGNDAQAFLGGIIFPASIGLRQSFGELVDLSAILGAAQSAVELRIALPSSPFVLSSSFRSGQLGLLGKPDIYDARVRMEGYLRLPGAVTDRHRLALTVGVAGGRFVNLVPNGDVSEFDGASEEVQAEVYRREVRLELGVGFERRTEGSSVMIALIPWFLAASGPPETSGSDLLSYSQDLGLSLVLSLSLGGDAFRP